MKKQLLITGPERSEQLCVVDTPQQALECLCDFVGFDLEGQFALSKKEINAMVAACVHVEKHGKTKSFKLCGYPFTVSITQ